MQTYSILLLTFFAAIGCGGEAVEKNPDAGSLPSDSGPANIFNPVDASGSDSGPDTAQDSRPQVFEISANPASISPDESTVVSALVGDPQGVDDIIAVRLLDTDAETILGAMENISGGSYQIAVSWDQLNDSTAISFDAPSGERTLFVEAVDSSNQRTQSELVLGLSCPDSRSACQGVCGLEECNGECLSSLDLMTRENCGTCGNACSEMAECSDGACVAFDGNPGGPCTSATQQADCGGENPFCVAEDTGGYCAYTCEIMNGTCPVGTACVVGTIGFCFKTCTTDDDCRNSVCTDRIDSQGMAVRVCEPPPI